MVTWRPPIPSNGIILHYIVQYKKFNDSQYSSLSPLGLEATITGLQEGEQYNIRVRAYTIIGGGSFSDANSSTCKLLVCDWPAKLTGHMFAFLIHNFCSHAIFNTY